MRAAQLNMRLGLPTGLMPTFALLFVLAFLAELSWGWSATLRSVISWG